MDTTKLKTRLGGKVQALQEPAPQSFAVVSEPASVPVDSGYLALTSNAMDIIKANLKNQPLSFQLFDIVKAPSGGSTVFSVPGLAGDEAEKELDGDPFLIIQHHALTGIPPTLLKVLRPHV